ncbi:tyrosine-type recombinase/integrase [Mammaliicoccus sciuri]|uniref:tyrosine-type recombinase/integrase n=2 Tax=Mammaliicoccus sciuri TaxID=1296 RepID=UPI0034DDC186
MKTIKRNNKWQYDFGYEGKRYRKGGFKTKKEAIQAGNERYNLLFKGYKVNDQLPFTKYYHDWVKINIEGQVSDKTYNRYLAYIQVFEEKFGDLPLNKLTQLKYRELLKEYGEGKYLNTTRDGRTQIKNEGRTTNSVQKLHYNLRTVIKDALLEGLIYRDPTIGAKPKGIKSAKLEEEKYITITQLNELKQYVSERKELSHLFLYILIITGGRFSEVQNLQYSHLKQKDNKIHLPGTKTDAAPRTIPISNKDMTFINNFLQEREMNSNNYIFHTGVGLITNASVTKVYKNFCLKNKIGNRTLHSIRHTHCSMLIHEGVSIYYISKRLGHTSINTTLSIYSHLLEETEKQEDEKIIEILERF